jgi:uncharacterized protein CbrC (UPF0167 family)
MNKLHITRLDRALANLCRNCPVCQRARRYQRGLAFWLVTKVETKLCPFCRAYKRVYQRSSSAACSTNKGTKIEDPRNP